MFWKRKKRPTVNASAPAPNIESLLIQAVVKTDLGNVRTNNEDTVQFKQVKRKDQTQGAILLVADGMGGHLAGEVASNMAAEIIIDNYFHHPKGKDIPENLTHAFKLANRTIYQSASQNSQQKGMGTTCTALVWESGCLYFAHAGDSRAYHLRENKISRITTDHTYVQELVNNGSISAEEADKHPQRNVLTNAMGTKPDLRVESGCYSCELKAGDSLMVCSDGLYDYFNDQELAEIVGGISINEVAEQLVAKAKARGGHDNISVIVARIGKTEPVEKNGKETREASMLKITRDVELPDDLS